MTNTLISETVDTIVSNTVRHFVLYFSILSPPNKIPKAHTFVSIIEITIGSTFSFYSPTVCKIMQFPFFNQRIQCSRPRWFYGIRCIIIKHYKKITEPSLDCVALDCAVITVITEQSQILEKFKRNTLILKSFKGFSGPFEAGHRTVPCAVFFNS